MGYIYAGVGGLILVLSVVCYIFYQDAVIAEAEVKQITMELDKAEDANKAARKATEALKRAAEVSRQAEAKEAVRASNSDLDHGKIKEESRNAPDANEPLSPYWVDHYERLRAADERARGGKAGS